MKNSEIIQKLNELFEEAILGLPDEEVLAEIKKNPNPAFSKQLKYIRKLNTKAKASLQKSLSLRVWRELENLIQKFGRNNLVDQLMADPRYKDLGILCSKYENISEADAKSIFMEGKVLELVKAFKKEIGNEEPPQ